LSQAVNIDTFARDLLDKSLDARGDAGYGAVAGALSRSARMRAWRIADRASYGCG
jgi:hypothetical protein